MNSFRERYDLQKLGYALENLDCFFDKETQEDNKKQTKKFLEQLLINNGEMSYNYVHARYTNYGRKYSYGIQNISKKIRNYLLTGSGVMDYDIKNAHPTILYYLCVKHKIHTEKQLLKSYVFNRDEVIQQHFQKELYNDEDVKKLILTATNCDDMLFTENEWLVDYHDEMMFIREQLQKHKGYKKILNDTERLKQDSRNMNSSFVNRVLCKVESEIIDKITAFIMKKKFEVFALMFDGLMVYNGTDELLEQINLVVKTAYGDYFNITQKDIVTDIDDTGYELNLVILLGNIDSMETRMKRFIDKFKPIKIINPPLYGIKSSEGEYSFHKKDAFIQATEHIKYTNEKNQQASVVNKWLNECISEEDIYDNIITDPEYTGTDNFNLWTDWDVNNWQGDWTYDEKAVKFWRQHILVMCNYDEAVAHSIELWIAHMFKYPKNKSFVPIFVGKQGTGKDMLIAMITKLMGEKKKFETSTPEKNIWGSFNPFMKSAYLIHLSEFGRKNTQDYVGNIKAITTTGRIMINEKNKGEYEINSYHRFVGASNYGEPLPIESDNRRFQLILTSSDKIGDTEYFNEGWGYIKDKNAMKSIYDYFINLDVPEQLQYHMIKESEYTQYLKGISKPQEESFLQDFICEHMKAGKVEKFRTLDVYDKYLKWCNDTRQSFKMEKRKFLVQLKNASNTTPHIIIKKTSGNIYAIFDWDALHNEGKYSKGEEEECDDIEGVCSEEEEQEGG